MKIIFLIVAIVICGLAADNTELRNAKCTFPFTYKDDQFNYCTKINSNKYWCSEKADYDGKWHYCEETHDDKFDRIFKTLDKYVNEIDELRAKLAKLGDKKCGCHAEIDILEKALKRTDIVVKDHERRLKDTDRNTQLITIINQKITKIEVLVPRIVKVIHIVEKSGGGVKPPVKPKVTIPSGTHCRGNFGRGYLFVPNHHLNWLQADRYCRRNGMILAKIRNSAENMWVARTAISIRNDRWWFGANDLRHEGNWRYSDQSGVGFKGWHSGEPNNNRNEDCANFGYWKSTPWMWNDWYCHMRSPFICEGRNTNCIR